MAVRLVRGSETLELDGNPYWLEGFTGFGAAPLRHQTSQGPEQHGATWLDFRLQPRTIGLVIGFCGTDYAQLLIYRQTLLAFCDPWGGLIAVEFEYPDGAKRRIDCILADDLDMASNDRAGFYQKAGLTLLAADPTWYNPNAQQYFVLSGSGDTFTVPTPVPTGIGRSTFDDYVVIYYPGTAPAYPRIRFIGPLTNPVLYHQSMGWKLDFTGTTIAAGSYYEINCAYGYKTVIDSAGTNRIDKLTADSNLAEFAIMPHPIVANGINNIRFTASNISDASALTIIFYDRYIGI